MEISASVLAVKDNYLDYADTLKSAFANYLHIDIFQEGTEFKIANLLEFKDKETLPLDIHLIYEEIDDETIEIINSVNARYVNIQYENLKDKSVCKKLAKKFHAKFGIAITSKTPISVLDEYIDDISQVLFMCSEPGVSGAKFDDSNFRRVQDFKDKYPCFYISVDGGVNREISEKFGKLGVDMVVSGSYLSKNMNRLDSHIYSLKYNNEDNVNVLREMIPVNDLPILGLEASFVDIINTMNKYRQGVVYILKDDCFQGIITDGDIRRGFISYGENIFHINANNLVNKHPYTVGTDISMKELYHELSSKMKGIDNVPIIEGDRLIGAVDLRFGIYL